jgi:hypothetical protein
MKKVIDIMHGTDNKELDSLPFTKEMAEQFIEYIVNYRIDNAEVHFGERYMINQVLRFIENNSGANTMEVLEKIQNRKGA